MPPIPALPDLIPLPEESYEIVLNYKVRPTLEWIGRKLRDPLYLTISTKNLDTEADGSLVLDQTSANVIAEICRSRGWGAKVFKCKNKFDAGNGWHRVVVTGDLSTRPKSKKKTAEEEKQEDTTYLSIL